MFISCLPSLRTTANTQRTVKSWQYKHFLTFFEKKI